MEDDVLLMSIWQEILVDAGHDVTPTRNATEAWTALGTVGYDLLVSDIYVKEHGALVPDGGVVLLARARQLSKMHGDRRGHMPILAVSGGAAIPGGFDPLRTARDMGADMVLRKPISASQLIEAVEALLEPNPSDAATS